MTTTESSTSAGSASSTGRVTTRLSSESRRRRALATGDRKERRMPNADEARSEPRGFALVIGGGGAVAAASCLRGPAGTVRDRRHPSLGRPVVIGTSAGAAMAPTSASADRWRTSWPTCARRTGRVRHHEGVEHQARARPPRGRGDLGDGPVDDAGPLAHRPVAARAAGLPGSLIAIAPEHWDDALPRRVAEG